MRPAVLQRGKRILLTMAITAMLGGLVTVSASPSSAATSVGGGAHRATATRYTTWWMNNYVTGLCVDDSAPYGLRAIGCNGLNYQLWYQVWRGGINYAMQNVHTGRCLDDSAPYGLRSYPCNGQNYQEWTVESSGAAHFGWFVLKNVHTGLCLDDSAAYGLRAFQCNGQTYQLWY
jgi:hypothetical protein